jgi:hypothetical protein
VKTAAADGWPRGRDNKRETEEIGFTIQPARARTSLDCFHPLSVSFFVQQWQHRLFSPIAVSVVRVLALIYFCPLASSFVCLFDVSTG